MTGRLALAVAAGALCAAAALGPGCDTGKRELPPPPPTANPTGAARPTPAPNPPPAANPAANPSAGEVIAEIEAPAAEELAAAEAVLGDQRIPVETDFAIEAAAEITADNYKAQLDALAAEFEADTE